MPRLTIQARIASVSVAFIVGLVTIGITDWRSERSLRDAYATQKDLAAISARSGSIRADSLGLKVASRDLRFERSDADADAFQVLDQKLTTAIQALADQSGAVGLRTETTVLQSAMAALTAQFDAIHKQLAALNGDDGMAAVLDKASTALDDIAGSTARDNDTDAGVQRLAATVSSLRQIEAAYRFSLDDSLLGASDVLFGRYNRLLDHIDLPADAKASLADAIKSYTAAFGPWSAAERAFMLTADQLTGASDLIGARLQALDEVVSTRSSEAVAAAEAARALTQRAIRTTIALAILTGLAAAFFVARTTAVPLRRLRNAMLALASGRTQDAIPFTRRRDEIGEMAQAVEVFRDNAVKLERADAEQARLARETAAERDRNEAERSRAGEQQRAVVAALATGLERLAAGHLTWRIEDAFGEDYEKLRQDFNAAMQQVANLVTTIAGSVATVRDGAAQTSTAAGELARRTEQQAGSLEETAAALDEITATVKTTSTSALHARHVVGTAKDAAEGSGRIVNQAVEAMTAIAASSREIGQIIGLIDEIAFQTNLLALNAGVEAARAGETGRGFAVVASEVRSLAQRSAEAAKAIKALVQTSAAHVDSGVALVGKTGDALGRIVGQVAELNTLVADIARAAQEQATGLDQVNGAVNEMDRAIQDNATVAERSTAVSEDLVRESDELARLIGRFEVGTEAAPQPAARASVRASARQGRGPTGRLHASVASASVALRVEDAEDPGEWDQF